MHNLPKLLILITIIFILFCFPTEKAENRWLKIAVFISFAIVETILITFGAQTGLLFDGRAQSENWLTEMLLPTLAFSSGVSLIMYHVSREIFSAFPFYFRFVAAFSVSLFLIVIGIAVILVSVMGS